MLAYLQWNPAKPAAFDSPPYARRAFPIIDSSHFFGFDLFCAWQDVYLMSLMFFLSGLFVWPSLARKNDWRFLRDRLLRLGLPYLFGVFILIPIATYPVYAMTAADPGRRSGRRRRHSRKPSFRRGKNIVRVRSKRV